jgi:hypothetical protein
MTSNSWGHAWAATSSDKHLDQEYEQRTALFSQMGDEFFARARFDAIVEPNGPVFNVVGPRAVRTHRLNTGFLGLVPVIRMQTGQKRFE